MKDFLYDIAGFCAMLLMLAGVFSVCLLLSQHAASAPV
jgi:hypothetical protein